MCVIFYIKIADVRKFSTFLAVMETKYELRKRQGDAIKVFKKALDNGKDNILSSSPIVRVPKIKDFLPKFILTFPSLLL